MSGLSFLFALPLFVPVAQASDDELVPTQVFVRTLVVSATDTARIEHLDAVVGCRPESLHGQDALPMLLNLQFGDRRLEPVMPANMLMRVGEQAAMGFGPPKRVSQDVAQDGGRPPESFVEWVADATVVEVGVTELALDVTMTEASESMTMTASFTLADGETGTLATDGLWVAVTAWQIDAEQTLENLYADSMDARQAYMDLDLGRSSRAHRQAARALVAECSEAKQLQ